MAARLSFMGERSLPWSEPQRLGRTPHSGTQVPQRLLMLLRRGRLCPPPFRHRLPSLCGRGRASAPSSRRCRPSAPLAHAEAFAALRARADHRGRTSGLCSCFTRRASTSCHSACGPPPGRCLLDLGSASEGTPGRLRVGQVRWCLLAGARPRSVGAVPGRRRERHSPLLVRRSRPAPCSPLAGFATPLGHEERKGLVSCILKRLVAGEDGVTPVGPDPEFNGDSPGFALLLAVAALPFAGLAGRIELGCLRTAGTALLGLGCGALWN